MAKSINNVTLLGNLTKDPVGRSISETAFVAEFSLALNREYVKDGEYKETVDYIDVVVWGNQAKSAVEYLKKGDRCLVQGRFQSRTWDDKETGAKKSKIEVLADDLTFLGQKKIEVQNG